MSSHPSQSPGDTGNTRNPGIADPVSAAAQQLMALLDLLTGKKDSPEPSGVAPDPGPGQLLDAMNSLLSAMNRQWPLQADLHERHVYNPSGPGALAFGDDVMGSVLRGIVNDEQRIMAVSDDKALHEHRHALSLVPARPIVIHVEVQPNKSPHCGALVVLCFAFAVAHAIRRRVQNQLFINLEVSVEVALIDTAPAKPIWFYHDGVLYQKSLRDVHNALTEHLGEYNDILTHLSSWSGIDFHVTAQAQFFNHPYMPRFIQYLASRHRTIGSQLSPKHGTLGLSAACPAEGCQLADKRGRMTQYRELPSDQASSVPQGGATSASAFVSPSSTTTPIQLIFNCPKHGPHILEVGRPGNTHWANLLEADGPARTLLQSMVHMTDIFAHHVLVTGADRAGTYHETTLLRPLAEWTATMTGDGIWENARGRMPHILYAPLVTDWSGARLCFGSTASSYWSTSAWARSSRLMRYEFGDDGLRRLWEEVLRWVADPKKVFRCYSVLYLRRIMEGAHWPVEHCTADAVG
ncbi:hypothetical protein C8A03DRAFT_33708 [Achaetomium macrosporum]|uniref:Uncharacterized protein n=1 Tax=Achaetomium macrosporum TaxID=79813 RepID=A0AAN7CAN6_9PEZI|nr:hypothetical protein C8A03DRAFT_33708 [Achaetomium macrosporum]